MWAFNFCGSGDFGEEWVGENIAGAARSRNNLFCLISLKFIRVCV